MLGTARKQREELTEAQSPVQKKASPAKAKLCNVPSSFVAENKFQNIDDKPLHSQISLPLALPGHEERPMAPELQETEQETGVQPICKRNSYDEMESLYKAAQRRAEELEQLLADKEGKFEDSEATAQMLKKENSVLRAEVDKYVNQITEA